MISPESHVWRFVRIRGGTQAVTVHRQIAQGKRRTSVFSGQHNSASARFTLSSLPMPPPSSFSNGSSVLLVEDESLLSRRIVAFLEAEGLTVNSARKLAEARNLLAVERYDYALVDLHLPDGLGLALLREGAFSENTNVVVLTAYGGIADAVEAMRLGASDFLTKPFDLEAVPLAFLRSRAKRCATRRDEHRSAGSNAGTELFFGESLAAIRRQLDQLIEAERRLTGAPPPLTIEGKTGTGKSMLARWVHRQGPRADRRFVSVNCAA